MAYGQGQDPYGQQPGGYGQQPPAGGYGQPPASGGGGYGQPPYSGGGGYGGGGGVPGGPTGEVSTGQLVLSFILCWPFFIFVIITNNRAKDLLARGDAAGAATEFESAHRVKKIGYIVGGILWGLSCLCSIAYVIFAFVLVGTAATTTY
jgi:hypothetical protein